MDPPGDRPGARRQGANDPHPRPHRREAQQDPPRGAQLVTELGREPTPEEIAEITGIEPEEVDSIKRSAQAPVSLEKPVGDEEESEFGQFIADERAESPFERAAEIFTKEALKEALENLSYRERRVLELRYGLGGEDPRTLDEVGRTFNVTRERIRQIENQSLKKLQSLAEAQKPRTRVADLKSRGAQARAKRHRHFASAKSVISHLLADADSA